MLQIAVLGPISVRRDGELVKVPGGKSAELLVRLALDAGHLVSADRLVEDLWGERAADTSRNTLQSKVARLRRALGDSTLLVGRDGGYELAVDPSAVDALAVLADADSATSAFAAGDHPAAIEQCTAALGRFAPELLPAAGDGDWVAPHGARLEEARTTLIETMLAARVRLGETADVVGDLERAVAEFPYNETLWELLIGALYRSGRQADALAAYQRVRVLLADELGLEPGPSLRRLEQQILAHDVSIDDATRPARAPDVQSAPGNLPSLTVELVGRAAELTALGEELARSRLVEIVGPGGIGKTALAVATARAIAAEPRLARGGVWLVRLEGATTSDEVVDAVIAALHVSGGEAALLERLKGAPSLLVIDNCEHVVEAAAPFVGRLLDAAPGLRVLATSQVALDLDGEVVVELAPLAPHDAVELFTRRATRYDATTDGAVRELCLALDGLPLAIELAAARTKTLPVDEIIRRLDDRFAVLYDPTSRRPERRRALRATIGWSYDLLFPDDQRGLWALATFAGEASLPAVEHVLAALDVPVTAAIDVIGRLASRSLVAVDADGATSSVRYRLLDSIRAFALEALDDAGLTERASRAHASWLADAARASTAGVRSARQAEFLDVARAERANIDAALAWCATHDPGLGLEIATGFGWAWIVLGDSRGAQRLHGALAAAGDAAPVRHRASALLLAAWIEASTGDLDLACDHVAAAEALADGAADVDLQARCCYHLAYVVSHHGDWERALELTARSRVLYDTLDRPWDQAANALFASRAAISAADEQRSLEARDQVEHWLATVDDPWLHVRREAMLGELARVQHRFDDAVVHIGRAAATSERLGFRQTEAYQVSSLGRAQCQAGDYEAGAATLALAIEKAEGTGDLRLAALARVHLGRVLRALGDDAGARAVLEHAVAWHREVGGGEQAALGECLLAAMDAADGGDDAVTRLRQILDATDGDDDAARCGVRVRRPRPTCVRRRSGRGCP